MRTFADLYARLDATTSNNAKLAAMIQYFKTAPPEDAAWGAYFLAGGKPRQLVPAKVLRLYATSRAGVPDWLFEESYQAVGDLAETLALLLPPGTQEDSAGLALWMTERLLPLRGLDPVQSMLRLDRYLDGLDTQARFVCAKLITGSFRVGVSRLLVTRALGEVAQVDAKRIALRMIGYTDISAQPDARLFSALIGPLDNESATRLDGQPYPFFLAHPLAVPTDQLFDRIGAPSRWQIEWKWDGIRAQIVRRAERTWVWSRGEELVTERFPELVRLGKALPEGVVIDGEIVVWQAGKVQPFSMLQQRLGRKTVGAKLLADIPVVLLAYDILEVAGEDWREHPQHERRAELEKIHAHTADPGFIISPLLDGPDWAHLDRQRQASRSLGVEGMMLKALDARYGVGRTKASGVWWKWKVDPFSIDAVLIYAQRGHGRRASLYTDYTFGVWDGPPGQADRKLVPIAKAYSGLTDEEIHQVDAVVHKTTVEKFGPVRSVQPSLVFELGFEGIARSVRHKSGVALRFPRMLRWRHDKRIDEADTLATLEELLPQ